MTRRHTIRRGSSSHQLFTRGGGADRDPSIPSRPQQAEAGQGPPPMASQDISQQLVDMSDEGIKLLEKASRAAQYRSDGVCESALSAEVLRLFRSADECRSA